MRVTFEGSEAATGLYRCYCGEEGENIGEGSGEWEVHVCNGDE